MSTIGVFQLRRTIIQIISSLFNELLLLFLYYLFVSFMKCFLLGLQYILFFSLKTNCNDLNYNCFYILMDSKPFGRPVNF